MPYLSCLFALRRLSDNTADSLCNNYVPARSHTSACSHAHACPHTHTRLHICTYTLTPTYPHAHTCMHARTPTHAHLHARTHAHARPPARTGPHACTYTRTPTCSHAHTTVACLRLASDVRGLLASIITFRSSTLASHHPFFPPVELIGLESFIVGQGFCCIIQYKCNHIIVHF